MESMVFWFSSPNKVIQCPSLSCKKDRTMENLTFSASVVEGEFCQQGSRWVGVSHPSHWTGNQKLSAAKPSVS